MSFLPGLGLEEPEEIQKVESSKYDLAKDTEWRFEVAFGKYTQVKVWQTSSGIDPPSNLCRLQQAQPNSSVQNS